MHLRIAAAKAGRRRASGDLKQKYNTSSPRFFNRGNQKTALFPYIFGKDGCIFAFGVYLISYD
jgi:hypothetical protein